MINSRDGWVGEGAWGHTELLKGATVGQLKSVHTHQGPSSEGRHRKGGDKRGIHV